MDQSIASPQITTTPPDNTNTSQLPNVPAEWPGGFGLYKYSKQAVKRSWFTILALFVLSMALGLMAGSFHGKSYVVMTVLSQLVGMILGVATTYTYLESVRGRHVELPAAFRAITPMLVLKYIAVSLLVGLILTVSFLVLIIPFFFVLPRVLLTPYFVVDKGMGPIESIKASWNATKGHVMKVWATIGVSIAMALLLITIIGIPLALYFLFMYLAAQAILYFFLTESSTQVAPAPNTVVQQNTR